MERPVSRRWTLDRRRETFTDHTKGSDLCPDGRDRGRRHDLAPRTLGRGAELGLSLETCKNRKIVEGFAKHLTRIRTYSISGGGPVSIGTCREREVTRRMHDELLDPPNEGKCGGRLARPPPSAQL